jgi:predicted DNA-binding transcriptional regulator YafY
MAAEKQIRRKNTARELAEKFGVHPRTVQRYIALPRDQYLAESITRAAPWEALGMSRATWYRKGRPMPQKEQIEPLHHL